MKKKRKGLFGGLIIPFVIALTVVLAVLIFLFAFKVHIIQTMVDYYVWVKEYDIPMALFSMDAWYFEPGIYTSPAVAFSKIHYELEDHDVLENDITRIASEWFGVFGDFNITFEDVRICKTHCRCTPRWEVWHLVWRCRGSCSEYEGVECNAHFNTPCEEATPPAQDIIGLRYYGIYPLPVVFNGTHRVIALIFTSERIR